jgi:hypothetical protein
MFTLRPQLLIWLARNSTSPRVAFGTPHLPTANDMFWSAFMASGITMTGLFILDCIFFSSGSSICFVTTLTKHVGKM